MSARAGARWTAEDVVRASVRIGERIAMPLNAAPPARPRKYKNRTTIFQGQQFDSERECEAWKNFELQRIAGAIRAVISQISLRLPGTRRRIRVDFLVIENDLTHRWYDAKGFETQAWALKRRQVLDAYGITIHLI